jgi:hypothetical protein
MANRLGGILPVLAARKITHGKPYKPFTDSFRSCFGDHTRLVANRENITFLSDVLISNVLQGCHAAGNVNAWMEQRGGVQHLAIHDWRAPGPQKSVVITW